MKQRETEPMVTDNLKRFHNALKSGSKFTEYEGLVACIADVLDTAASGSECYAVIGCNRNRDSFMLTVTIGREKLYASGPSLVAVSEDAARLL